MLLIRRNALTALVFVLLILFAVQPAHAIDYYADVLGGPWNANTTWRIGSRTGPIPSAGVYPGTGVGDRAFVDFQGITVTLNTVVPNPVTVNWNNVACSLDVNAGAVLPLTGASFIGGGCVLNFNGGTINNAGVLDIGVNSGMNWTGGTLTGIGSTRLAADTSIPALLTLSGGILDGHTLNVNGKVAYTGSWVINNGGQVNISSTGVFDVQTTGPITTNNAATADINNSGTFKKTAGGGGTNIDVPVNNDNLVEVTTGVLVLGGPANHTNGTFNIVNAGNAIEFHGTFNGTNNVTGAGHASIVGTPVIADGATVNFTNIQMNGGWLQGPATGTGTANVSGTVTFNGGVWQNNLTVNLLANSIMNFVGGADGFIHDALVVNNSTININSGPGTLGLNDGGTIENFGLINLIGDVTINSNSVNNARIDGKDGSLIEKTAGAAYATFNTIFNNSGTYRSLSGHAKFNKSGTHSGGSFEACDTCSLEFLGGNHTLDTTTITYTNTGNGSVTKLAGATFNVTLNGAQIDTAFHHLVGTVTGAGDLTINNAFTWGGGTHSGTGKTILMSSPNHLFNGTNGPMILNDREMEINGILAYSPVAANHLAIDSGAVLRNKATINLTTDAPINSDGAGGAVIINEATATFAKTGGAGLAKIACAFDNKPFSIIVFGGGPVTNGLGSPGTINVAVGQLALNGGGTNEGNIFLPNAVNALVFEANTYTFAAGTTFNPADLGLFRISGGTLNLGIPLSLKFVELLAGAITGADFTIDNKLKWTGGTILGPGNTTIGSTATVSHLLPTLPTFLDNRTLQNNGTFDYEGTGLLLRNNAVINNNPGATFNGRDGAILNGAGSNFFTNSGGTLRKMAGATGLRFDVPVKNNAGGAIQSEVSGQSLIFANGGSMDAPASMSANSGALIDFFSGLFSVNGGTLTGPGVFRVNGGTLAINAGNVAPTLEILSGAVDVPGGVLFQVSTLKFNGGALQNAGTTRVTIGGMIGSTAPTSLSGDHNLSIATPAFDYVADAANFLTINDTSLLNIESGAAFNITTDSAIAGPATASITNGGTLVKNVGAGTAQIGIPVTSSGTGNIGSTSGTLRMSGGGTITTPITTGLNGNVEFASNFALNAGVSVSGSGTITVSAGVVDVSVPLTIPNLTLSGGTLSGAGALTITNGSWTGGTLAGTGPASIVTSMNINTFDAKSLQRTLTNNGNTTHQNGDLGGTGSFVNNGSFSSPFPPTAVTFAPAFTNTGSAYIYGTIAFTGGYSQTGGNTILAGGTMSVPSTVNFAGGSVTGNGTIAANVSNSATVAPGASPGLITISGNYTQTPSGVLNIELAGTTPGTQYDRLAVTGNASLAGTVNVSLVPPFTLAGGEVFDVVTYGSRSGTFTTENLPPFPSGSFTSAYLANAYELAAISSWDVMITKTGPTSAAVGDIVDYTITVKNLGPGAAANVIVNDPTPAGFVFMANSGDCTTPFPCVLGTLSANQTKTINAKYKVNVRAAATTVVNTATLPGTDTDVTNNSSSASTVIACPNSSPSGLTPSGTGATSGTLTWGAVNAEIYQVFLGPKGTGCSMPFGTTVQPSMAYSGLQPDTEYEWRVESSFDGCPVMSSECVTFKTAPCEIPPAPVARVVGEATTSKKYSVEWEAVPNAIRYEVDQATNAAFSDAVTTSVTNALSLTFVHEVSAAQGFWYRVRAFVCDNAPGPYSLPMRTVVVPLPSKFSKNPSINAPAGSDEMIVLQVHIPGEPNQNLFFQAATDKPWAFASPPSGPLPPDGADVDVIIPDPDELPNGTFTVTLIATILPAAGSNVTTHGTTVSVPISVNLVTPVTPSNAKGGASQFALVVPGVGHLRGIDSFWQSDVRVTNTGFRKTKYRLTFTPSGGTSLGVKHTDISVDAGATTALDDIIKNWFGFGSLGDGESGMLEIVPLEDPENTSKVTVASSRTYNVTGNGTLGQFVPAIPFPSFIGKAAQNAVAPILSLQQIAQTSVFRSNFGLAEAGGQSANAVLSVFNAAGTKLLDINQSLAAGQQLQLNQLLAQHNLTLDDGRVEVKVADGNGKITAFASVIDNGTGDPQLISGVPLTGAGSTRYVMPGAANINTGFADWRTDLRIFNFGTVPQQATLTLFPMGGGATSTATVLANVGEVLSLNHVVKTLFGRDNIGGALHVTTNQPANFVISARTYNQTADGSLGQFVSAVTPEQGITAGGRSLHILQVEDSVRYRTNVGVYELSGKPALVELMVILPDSKATPSVEVPLAAFEMRQFNIIRELGLGNIYNARVVVRVLSGEGRVMAYGSLIDELTNDPAYIPAQQ